MLALKNKLKKDKFLSNEPSIQMATPKLFPPGVTSTSEGMDNKLVSRLLSSRTLSGAVNGVILSLYSTLKPTATEDDGNDVMEGSDLSRKLQNENFLVAAKSRATLAECGDVRTADRVTSPEADTDNELDTSAESEGDTNTSNDHDSATGAGPLLPRASTPPFDYSSDRASPIPHVGGVSKTPEANSVFLPTLSHGFIPGGSDTDWSDGEVNAGGSVRKNRRGQRARRA